MSSLFQYMKERSRPANKIKKLIYLALKPLRLRRKDSIIQKIGKQPVALARTLMSRTMHKS